MCVRVFYRPEEEATQLEQKVDAIVEDIGILRSQLGEDIGALRSQLGSIEKAVNRLLSVTTAQDGSHSQRTTQDGSHSQRTKKGGGKGKAHDFDSPTDVDVQQVVDSHSATSKATLI